MKFCLMCPTRLLPLLYSGPNPTDTERAEDQQGPLQRGLWRWFLVYFCLISPPINMTRTCFFAAHNDHLFNTKNPIIPAGKPEKTGLLLLFCCPGFLSLPCFPSISTFHGFTLLLLFCYPSFKWLPGFPCFLIYSCYTSIQSFPAPAFLVFLTWPFYTGFPSSSLHVFS